MFLLDLNLLLHLGQFKREHKSNTTLPDDPFTADQKEVVGAVIKQLDNKLRTNGKETMPTHLYQFYNEPETS
jgi:hypothetical protein